MKLRKTLSAGLGLALLAGICASASAAVDQSQLVANTSDPLAGGPNGPTGQSFTSGITGSLTEVDLLSDGVIQNGTDDVTFEVLSGDGTGGASLGNLTQTMGAASYDSALGGYPLAFDTSSLNINVTAGSMYTFLITSVSGSGDLASRGVLADSANPYAGGRAYEGAYYGDYPNDDLAFQTHVNPVPEPASMALIGAGLFGLIGVRRRRSAFGH